jgi:hypothetical protein
MDKSVKRVTVVEGSGEDRLAKVVYDDPNDPDESALPPMERAVRHVVSAALISAQVAYDTYLSRLLFRPHEKAPQDAPEAAQSRPPEESVETSHGQFDTRLD